MAVLEINNGMWAVERLDIPHEPAGMSGANADIPEGDLLEIIGQILKRMDKGSKCRKSPGR